MVAPMQPAASTPSAKRKATAPHAQERPAAAAPGEAPPEPVLPLTGEEAALLSQVMDAVKADRAQGSEAPAGSNQRLQVRTRAGEVFDVEVCRDEAATLMQIEIKRGSNPCMTVDYAAPRSNEQWIGGLGGRKANKSAARALCGKLESLPVDRLLQNREGVELSQRCLAALLRNTIAEDPGIAWRLPAGLTAATLSSARREDLIQALRSAANERGELRLTLNSARFLPAAISDALCKELSYDVAQAARTALDEIQQRSEPLIGVHWGPSLVNPAQRDYRSPLPKWLSSLPDLQKSKRNTPAKLFRGIERHLSPADTVDWKDVTLLVDDEPAAKSKFGLTDNAAKEALPAVKSIKTSQASLKARFEADEQQRIGEKSSFGMPKDMMADNPMYGMVGEFRRRLNRMGIPTAAYAHHQELLRSYSRFVSRLGAEDLPREALGVAGEEIRERCEQLFDRHADARRAGEARVVLKCFLQLPFAVQARIASRWSTGKDAGLIDGALLLAHGLLLPDRIAALYHAPSLAPLRRGFDEAPRPVAENRTFLGAIYRDDREWQRRQPTSLHQASAEAAAKSAAGPPRNKAGRNRIFHESLQSRSFTAEARTAIVQARSPLLAAVNEMGMRKDEPHCHENVQLLGSVRDAMGRRLDAAALDTAIAPVRAWMEGGEARMLNIAFNIPKETALDFPVFRDFIDTVTSELKAAGKLADDGLTVEQRSAFHELHRTIRAQWRDQHGTRWPSHLNLRISAPAGGGQRTAPRDEFITVGRPAGSRPEQLDQAFADFLAQTEQTVLRLQKTTGDQSEVTCSTVHPKTRQSVAIGLRLNGVVLEQMRLRTSGQERAVLFEASSGTGLELLKTLPSRFGLQVNADDIEPVGQDFSLNTDGASLDFQAGDPANGGRHFVKAMEALADGLNAGDRIGPTPEGLEQYRFAIAASAYLEDAVDDLPSYNVTLTAHADGTIRSAEVVNEDVIVVGHFPHGA